MYCTYVCLFIIYNNESFVCSHISWRNALQAALETYQQRSGRIGIYHEISACSMLLDRFVEFVSFASHGGND